MSLAEYSLRQIIKNVPGERYVIVNIEKLKNKYTLIRLDTLAGNDESILLKLISESATRIMPYIFNTAPNFAKKIRLMEISLEDLIKLKRKM